MCGARARRSEERLASERSAAEAEVASAASRATSSEQQVAAAQEAAAKAAEEAAVKVHEMTEELQRQRQVAAEATALAAKAQAEAALAASDLEDGSAKAAEAVARAERKASAAVASEQGSKLELRHSQHVASAAVAAQAKAEEELRLATPERQVCTSLLILPSSILPHGLPSSPSVTASPPHPPLQVWLQDALDQMERRALEAEAKVDEAVEAAAAADRKLEKAVQQHAQMKGALAAAQASSEPVTPGTAPTPGAAADTPLSPLSPLSPLAPAQAAETEQKRKRLAAAEAALAKAKADGEAELAHGRRQIKQHSLELARIGARLQLKDELLRTGLGQVAELRRRCAAAEAEAAAAVGAAVPDGMPSSGGGGGGEPSDTFRVVEQNALQALAVECTLAVELQAAEYAFADQSLTLKAEYSTRLDALSAGAAAEGAASAAPSEALADARAELVRLQVALEEGKAAATREALAIRHKCRHMLVSKDAELQRLHEQLSSQQSQQLRSRPHSSTSLEAVAQAAEVADAGGAATDGLGGSVGGGMSGGGGQEDDILPGVAAALGMAAAAGGGGSAGPATEAGLLAKARQQAMQEAELERWRVRTRSLEARLKGATEARKTWGLREAELNEKLEHAMRLLQAQGRLDNLEYLRNTLVKYFELGPESFDEVFPLLCGFLELSPEEIARAKAGHLAHLAGSDPTSLWGLLGSAAAPTAAPAGGERPSLIPPVPPPLTLAESEASKLPGGGVEAAPPRAEHAARAEKAKADEAARAEKMARMKKLLAAADKRIAQVSAELQERNAHIKMLEAKLGAA